MRLKKTYSRHSTVTATSMPKGLSHLSVLWRNDCWVPCLMHRLGIEIAVKLFNNKTGFITSDSRNSETHYLNYCRQLENSCWSFHRNRWDSPSVHHTSTHWKCKPLKIQCTERSCHRIYLQEIIYTHSLVLILLLMIQMDQLRSGQEKRFHTANHSEHKAT